MELSKDELITIYNCMLGSDAEDLMTAIALEIEKMELEEVDFDDDDGCAGGACKL
jgi:hypothetical protein